MRNERLAAVFGHKCRPFERLVVLFWDSTDVSLPKSGNHNVQKRTYSTKSNENCLHKYKFNHFMYYDNTNHPDWRPVMRLELWFSAPSFLPPSLQATQTRVIATITSPTSPGFGSMVGWPGSSVEYLATG